MIACVCWRETRWNGERCQGQPGSTESLVTLDVLFVSGKGVHGRDDEGEEDKLEGRRCLSDKVNGSVSAGLVLASDAFGLHFLAARHL